MLSPFLLRCVPPITISHLYLVLSLQSLLRILQSGGASGVLPLLDLRRYYADFPWNDYCFRVRDPSLCAERITELIVSGMVAYIPHSFSQPKPSKPWFNTACSRAIYDKEVALKRYLSLPAPESHALYISARNHAKSVLQLAKNSFIHRKCQNLSKYNPPRDILASSQKHLQQLYFFIFPSFSSTGWHQCHLLYL